MTQKHTPTPWKVYQFGGVQVGQEDTGEAICSMWGDKSEGEANAAHIVKCVNMHDELVRQNEIMKEALDVVADYDTGSTAGLAFTAKEALKKAGAL